MTRAFRSGARPSPTKAMIDDQKKAKVKRAFRSDDAYRVEAKKGGKMNAGLKAFLAKKKKRRVKNNGKTMS
jgi:hypothetical protein